MEEIKQTIPMKISSSAWGNTQQLAVAADDGNLIVIETFFV